MVTSIRVIHYLNQFFGGIGGEEKANVPLQTIEGPVGPGKLLHKALGGEGMVLGTVVCGDNYFNDEKENALVSLKEAIERFKPDVVVAGPAFSAGRYGLACGEVCKVAQRQGIHAVTAMYPENPALLECRREVYIFPTGVNPSGMASVLERVAKFVLKLAKGESIGSSDQEGYLPRGIRRLAKASEPGYKRAVDMLVAKLHGKPFKTEIPVLLPERVKPAPPIDNISNAVIAMVTTCGLIPKGNPDGQVSANADRYFRYSIEGLSQMESKDWGAFHAGYNNNIANDNANYILPLRPMRMLESQGIIGRIYPWIFTLSGCSTPVAISKRIGIEIAQELLEGEVDGCLLLSA
jgi:glycine reductase